MISTEPPYLTSQRFLEEIQVLFYEPFFQKHRKERWKTSTTPLATRACNSLIGADRDRSRTARSRGMFCCRFPAKSHSRRRCALTVTSLQSKCGHFAWFTWHSKMNGKVEDLTWRFVILYGFPEPVRFQSTYFPNCILSFTNSVKAQSSCSWPAHAESLETSSVFQQVSNVFIAETWIVVLMFEIL